MFKKIKYHIKRFYYLHRFRLVNNEVDTQQKVNAALSYNIIWGVTIMIFSLQAFSLVNEMDQVFYLVFPSFLMLYSLTLYMMFVKKIWRFVIHSYCIISFLIMYLEIFMSRYMIDVNVMLYATMIIFMAFSLLNNRYVYIYTTAVLLSVSVYLFQQFTFKTTHNPDYSLYVAFYSMVVLGFVGFVCHHFIRSMYLVIRKMQYAARKKKVLSDKLLRMTKVTQQSLKVKEEFLSTMSHELRSPLNTVIGFADLLEEENFSEKQLENLSCLQYSAENLLDLINDVLDYNKFDSGNLVLEQRHFGLKDILIASNSTFQQKIKNEDVRLSIRLDINLNNKYFIGDEVRVQQMLFNMIFVANMLNSKEPIELELFLGELNEANQRDVNINLFFKGQNTYLSSFQQMDKDEETLFDRGMGDSLLYLRTSISKKIAQAMGADFEYVYDPVSNASHMRFTAQWPEINMMKSKENNSSVDFHGLKILVVDDHELNVLLLTKILKKMGALVTVAYNGKTATEQACTESFDLILMDLNMPEINGLEASLMIKEVDTNVRIIALTGESKEQTYDKIREAKMDGFLQKPVDYKSLSREMYRVLHPLSESIVA